MHIYPWQIAPLAIEHRCLAIPLPKLASLADLYINICIYTYGIYDPPPYMSIGLCKTIPQHKFHIYRTMHKYLWSD